MAIANRVLGCLLLTLLSTGAMAAERPLLVTSDHGVTLAGTLLLPDTPAPSGGFPAMLLVQGSGPTDRDGSQTNRPVGLLRQLAEALVAKGIASARFDKRGLHANIAQLPQDQQGLAAFYTWEGAVGDLAAEFTDLKGQAGIDPARTGVAGHSEGGMLLLAALADGRIKPKVGVLLSTPGRPIGEILPEQLVHIMTRQGASAEVQQQFLAADRQIRAHIIETGQVPVDQVPPGLRALYPPYLGAYLRSQMQFVPADAARKAPMPFFALYAKEDTQISAERDGDAIRAALAGRQDGSDVTVLDGLGHNLKPLTTDMAGPVGPAALTAITDWLRPHL